MVKIMIQSESGEPLSRLLQLLAEHPAVKQFTVDFGKARRPSDQPESQRPKAATIILDLLGQGDQTMSHLIERCMAEGHSQSSASMAIRALAQKGKVERPKRGLYRLVVPMQLESTMH